MKKIREIRSDVMEIISFGEDGVLRCKALTKINREPRTIYHDFKVTPFEENLRALKPGKYVHIGISIMED